MAAKDIRLSSDARERMRRGIDTLANAVRVTLGPKGRNVVLDKSFGAPRVTKDGVEEACINANAGTNDTFWCVTRNWLDKGQRKPVRAFVTD